MRRLRTSIRWRREPTAARRIWEVSPNLSSLGHDWVNVYTSRASAIPSRQTSSFWCERGGAGREHSSPITHSPAGSHWTWNEPSSSVRSKVWAPK